MSMITDCLEAGIKLGIERLPDFIHWGKEMFESKQEKQEGRAPGELEAAVERVLNRREKADRQNSELSAMVERSLKEIHEREIELREAKAANEMEMTKRLAQRDFLGATEAELIGQSEIPADDVRMALTSLSHAGKAFYKNGRWYEKSPIIEVRRFTPRWSIEPES
jgi:hypothetical protein